MRKKTRFCAFLAALTMGLGILSGCTGAPASSAPAQAASVSAPASGAPAGKPDTSEAVTLTMYLIGDLSLIHIWRAGWLHPSPRRRPRW